MSPLVTRWGFSSAYMYVYMFIYSSQKGLETPVPQKPVNSQALHHKACAAQHLDPKL